MRNLIIFFIVFTNKNGMDRFNPPPIKKSQPPIKTIWLSVEDGDVNFMWN